MFKFKKIASVLASAAMVCSTVALAAAANYPAPFVKNGSADVAVVYGTMGAAQTDLTAATDIQASLASAFASQTASGSTVVTGDSVKLERGSDKFSLGDDAADFYSTLDSEELSQVLAEGTYTNDNNDDFDYTQEIDLSSDLVLSYFQDNDFEDNVPTIGFNLTDSSHILNYTLDFDDAAEGGTAFVDLEGTDIEMLGRSYYVVDASGDSNGVQLELLDSANSALVSEGTTSTVTVGSTSYEVGISFIDDDEVIVSVNGEDTNKLEEGEVSKIADDTYVAIKNILFNEKESGVSKVELSIGSGKITIQGTPWGGQEVQINEEDLSDIEEFEDSELRAYITNSSTDIESITLEWDLRDEAWLAPSHDLILPGFETVKLSMGGFVAPSEEVTSITNDGDDSIQLNTEVTDGDVEFNLLYLNGSSTGFNALGKDANNLLITSESSTLTFDTDTDNWFVGSWNSGDESESYVFSVENIDNATNIADNSVEIKSLGSGDSKTIKVGDNKDFGKVRLTVDSASEDTGATSLTISSPSSGSVSFNRLFTKEGLKAQLPILNTTATAGVQYINSTSGTATYVMNFTEEDDDENANAGASFTVSLGKNSDNEAQVSSVNLYRGSELETEDNSDQFQGYVISPLATSTLRMDEDQDTLDITYHGSEAYAEVYVSEAGAMISSDGNGTTLGTVVMTDSESSSASGKNLIVVGGNCVNSVAASLLGLPSGASTCLSDFSSKTTVTSGQFLIQTFDRSGGKVATLVAGYNAADTVNAASYLTSKTVDTTSGKKYTGTSATEATLVTA